LYLLHGWGEDETAWFNQGRVDFVMDNLIAEKKAKPMIIVMDNLNAVKPGDSAARFASRNLVPDPSDRPAPPPAPFGGAPGAARPGPGAPAGGPPAAAAKPAGGMLGNSAFTEMMLADLIPMIEGTYRVLPGAANRAMAGLSMGGAQTRATTMANLDKFSYIGLFSGGNIPLAQIKDPTAFKKQVKLVFFGNGQAERGSDTSRPAAEELKKNGINAVFYESPRTAHEFLTWRRCLNEFAPLLFR
jgi:enterochelin esterase family protein